MKRFHSWATLSLSRGLSRKVPSPQEKFSGRELNTESIASVNIWLCQSAARQDRRLMATLQQLSSANIYNEIWSRGISLHIRSRHLKEEICHLGVTSHPCSTFQGVYRRFNGTRGNGLFNLASEPGWILWLRIWQFHFHTLRKRWFYTCWLSPCVKRLFHHCQRQMQRTPSRHTEPPPPPQRSLVAADKRDGRTSDTFGEVCRLSHDVFIQKILFSQASTSAPPPPVLFICLDSLSQKCLGHERKPFTTRSPAGNCSTCCNSSCVSREVYRCRPLVPLRGFAKAQQWAGAAQSLWVDLSVVYSVMEHPDSTGSLNWPPMSHLLQASCCWSAI